MWETAIVVLIVLIAAAGVGYGLYRRATAKDGCCGCRRECGRAGGHKTDPTAQNRDPSDMRGKADR